MATNNSINSPVVTGTNTGNETGARIATIITGAGSQTIPLDADEFPFYKIVGTVLSKVTWANIKATLKTYFDTLYCTILGNADFYQYSIVTSVASGNLTVALKNYLGADPSASAPVKFQDIQGVIKTITSALSITKNAGTNWANLGSAELATKEVDLFLHIIWADTGAGYVNALAFSRTTDLDNASGFNDTTEKTAIFNAATSYTSLAQNNVNIGRFNAILSAGAGYTWSIPATSVIVNRPVFETRWLDYIPTMTWTGTTAPSGTITNNYLKYKISGNNCYLKLYKLYSVGGVGITRGQATIPFLPLYDVQIQASLGFTANNYIQQSFAANSTASADVFINGYSIPDRFIINGEYII